VCAHPVFEPSRSSAPDLEEIHRGWMHPSTLAARRTLQAKGRREVNTRTIVGTAIEQRKLVNAAVKATATARRGRVASKKTKGDDGGWGSLRGIDSSKPISTIDLADAQISH